MTVAHCLDRLRASYGIDAGPQAVAFAKAQIAAGRSLVATRRADGRETHFVILHGTPVLALWDAVTEVVVTFLRLNVDPARLQAFVAGMRASIPRPDMTQTIAAIKAAPQVEHDRLVAEARQEGGWAGQLLAAWAGVCARDHALTIDCPFTTDEPDLARRWRDAQAQGRDAQTPTAEIVPLPASWAPKFGTTHAARCAVED